MNGKANTVLSQIRQTLEAELKGMNLQNAELTEAEHAFIEEATTLIESAGYELDGFDTSDPDAVADALEQLADEEEGSEVAEQAMRLLAPAIVEEQGPVIAEVPSESNPSKKYQIRLGGDGNVYCSCPAWKYQKGKAPHERVCKHMKGLAKQIAQVTAKMAKAEDIGPLLAQHFSEELERGQTFIEQATALIQQAGYEMEDFEGASVEEMVDALAAVADEEGGEISEAANEMRLQQEAHSAASKKTEDDFFNLSRAEQRKFIDTLASKLAIRKHGKIRETPEFKRALDKLSDEWSSVAIESFTDWARDRAYDWAELERDEEPPEDARDTEPYDVMQYEK